MENNGTLISEPVTAIIIRAVKTDRMKDFEVWAQGMNLIARKYEGFLGTNVIRPRDPAHPEYVIVIRFDQYEHLKAFMTSAEREDYLKISEPMSNGRMSVQEQHGFDSFFTLPGQPHQSAAPARYKMAILTILALYPLLMVLSTLIAAIFPVLPRPWLVLLTLLVLVPLMTYFIMPWVTRIFRFWLYPKRGDR